MTTNQTVEEVNFERNKAQNKDINTEIQSAIDNSVHFLNVTITNENGQLTISSRMYPFRNIVQMFYDRLAYGDDTKDLDDLVTKFTHFDTELCI